MSSKQEFCSLQIWAQLRWGELPLAWILLETHKTQRYAHCPMVLCQGAQSASLYAMQLLRQKPLPHCQQSCTASAWHADPSCSLPQMSL